MNTPPPAVQLNSTMLFIDCPNCLRKWFDSFVSNQLDAEVGMERHGHIYLCVKLVGCATFTGKSNGCFPGEVEPEAAIASGETSLLL